MKATPNAVNWPSSTGPSSMRGERAPTLVKRGQPLNDRKLSHYNTPILGHADADKTRVILGCGSMWRAA